MDSDKRKSILYDRQASREENDLLISRMDSVFQAAKLRNTLFDKPEDEFHRPVEFSWSAFWKTFIYENLPPVIFSPLAAIFIEKSLSRAWHVSQNRGLCTVSTQHAPLRSIIISWLVIYPGSWMITIALFLAYFGDSELIKNIDTFQITLAYLCLFTRRLIISAKYGYFRPEELEKLCHPAPEWSADKTERKFIGRGWSNPEQYPGLIENEMTSAMDENDICLHGIPLQFDEKTSDILSKKEGSEIFTPKTSVTNEKEISSAFLLFNIIRTVYKKNFVPPYNPILYMTVFLIIFTPMAVKFFYGVNIFGSNPIETFITVMSITGFLICLQLFFFGLVCAIDFDRRIETTNKLGELIKYPGIKISSLFENHKGENNIFINLQKRVNVFGWMNIRNVLRSFGETYLYRIESYTSILVFYSLLCVAILNLIVWTEMRHHISSVYLIVAIITCISGISIYSIFKAIKLQSLSQKHRDFIRNEIFIIEQELSELENKGEDSLILKDLRDAKNLLMQADENINFKELIYKPTTIMGYSANPGVIGSVLGLVLTGCLFAVQGFVSTGIEYDTFGWFNF